MIGFWKLIKALYARCNPIQIKNARKYRMALFSPRFMMIKAITHVKMRCMITVVRFLEIANQIEGSRNR